MTSRPGRPAVIWNWAAVVTYRYSNAEMSADDRLTNPLGFQVTRYRRDPETLPEALARPDAQQLPGTRALPTAAPQGAAQGAAVLRAVPAPAASAPRPEPQL